MEEISLSRVINTLLENFKRIIVISFIGIVVGLIYSLFFIDKMYMASSTIVIPKSGLIEEYSRLITSNEILENVSTKFNLSKSDIKENLKVDLKNKKIYTIKIVVTNKSQSMPSNIANAISNEFINVLKKTYSVNNAKISQVAEEPTQYYNYNNTIIVKNCLKVCIIFAGIYIFIILSIEFFSNKIKTEKYVKDILKMNVLATISEENKKKIRKYYEVQYDNLTNRIIKCLESNGKQILMFSNVSEVEESFKELLKSFAKLDKKVILLNLDNKLKINSIENITIKKCNQSEINNLSEGYDIVLINAGNIDGVSVNEKIFDIVNDIVIFAKRSKTKISYLELATKILNNYNKTENTHCIMVGEDFVAEYEKYKKFKQNNI